MAMRLQRFNQLQDQWLARLERLTARERIALAFMALVLSVALIASLLWWPHRAAEQQRERFNDLNATLQWMQSNAAQLPADTMQDATPLDKIQRIAQQQGISVQVQDLQGQIRIAAIHPQYAVLANLLTQLTAQGISIRSMTLQRQADGSIALQATVD